jgi:hypothetical protein
MQAIIIRIKLSKENTIFDKKRIKITSKTIGKTLIKGLIISINLIPINLNI